MKKLTTHSARLTLISALSLGITTALIHALTEALWEASKADSAHPPLE